MSPLVTVDRYLARPRFACPNKLNTRRLHIGEGERTTSLREKAQAYIGASVGVVLFGDERAEFVMSRDVDLG